MIDTPFKRLVNTQVYLEMRLKMFWHAILTTFSLIFFLVGFFMIGIGNMKKFKDQRSLILLIGFALIVSNLIYLGSVVLSQMLV